MYAKSQGLPVKIWGFFANGRLECWVLPADGARSTTHMNGARYQALVAKKFGEWRRACFGDDAPVHLVQDHERCLWVQESLAALRSAGCCVLHNYPEHSPDLNAIEGQWHVLRQRLLDTEPEEF